MSSYGAGRTLEAVQSLRLRGSRPIAIGELMSALATPEDTSVQLKNLHVVTYVTADLSGEKGSPVYASRHDDHQSRRARQPTMTWISRGDGSWLRRNA